MPQGHWRRLGLVIFAAAVLYLIGNSSVGLWDRDEPRYAQTSKQMLQSDPPDWVVPRLLDEVRTAKPIFIYWCQATAMKFLGPTPAAARLPSALAMVLTLAAVSWGVSTWIGPRRAVWTVFILATSALAIAAAKMCITDAVLLLWITLAQMCLYGIYAAARKVPPPVGRLMPPRTPAGLVVGFWFFVGLAGLTKGPVVLGVSFMTMLILAVIDGMQERCAGRRWTRAFGWWGQTRPLWGLLILAAVVAPWLYSIHRRDPSFLSTAIGNEILRRSVKPMEGHKGPPGFYLATIWGAYLPWSLLLPTAMSLGWKHRELAPLRFALAAAIGPWLLMEFVQTKLVHYILPAYPPLAFLTADALVRCIRRQHDDLTRPIALVAAGVWAIIIIALALLPWATMRYFAPLPPKLYTGMLALSLVGVIWAVVVFRRFRRGQIAPAAGAMGAGMLAVIAILYRLYLPYADFLWLPQRVGAFLQRNGATKSGDVVMVDYAEDSLPYYQGGTIRKRGKEFLLRQPPERWPTWIVITRDAFSSLPPAVQSRLEVLEQCRGVAYADKMRRVELLVVKNRRGVEKDP